ncbi:MAG: DUF4349 domain-containing protein [Marinomonas sp.]
MRKNWIIAAASVSLLTLSAGSESSDGVSEASFEGAEADMVVAEAASADGESANTTLPELSKMPVSLPQLAYVYDYAWQMPADDIGKLQRRHASLCEQQGPSSCQILGMNKSGANADAVSGVLQLAVASRQARAFGALLEDEAEDAGAEALSTEIASEELSKKLVDTEARLRSRTELRDRLQDVLRTRKGTVEELVEAERSVARVNEEIDQARSWMKEMEGRIAYSRINIRYETGVPVTSDFLGPVTSAVSSLGSVLGYLAAFLILVGAVVGPIAALVWAGARVNRHFSKPEIAPEPAEAG